MNTPGLEEAFTQRGFRRVIQAVRELAAGGTNALGTFGLAPGATRTVVEDRQCQEKSLPVLVATSAAAGAAGAWVESVGRGRFTVGHFAAPEGAVFRYELRQP